MNDDSHNWPEVQPPKPASLPKQLKRLRAKQRSAENVEKISLPKRKRGGGGKLPSPEILLQRLMQWFDQRGWQPFPFQHELWNEALQTHSGLLHATTGAGKTWAAWGGAMLAASLQQASGLRVLWITPMRALAQDTTRALEEPLTALSIDWEVGLRTGDTTSAERARQTTRLPEALVTTPESLSVMLSHPDAHQRLKNVAAVIVDEWHEMLGNKRGVQVQLALARLKRWNPKIVVWGLSATLGNLDHARVTLAGNDSVMIRGAVPKAIVIDSLLPHSAERFPWAGHLGLNMLEQVVEELDESGTTLLFTNTRSQAELWYQAILAVRPEWAGVIALHHGSLDTEVRSWVELGLKEGRLRAVVCTSSLDLGVDFLPVERVLQLGSPKGVARLLQRAGRSGHAPGRVSRVTCVPAQGLELLEAAAARRAALAQRIEPRVSPKCPLDVLVQHLVTLALGGGFEPNDVLPEIRSTCAYTDLSDEDWQWALNFIVHGGQALGAYPEYRRVSVDADGIYRVEVPIIARRHRMSIGTITADSAMTVSYLAGSRIGSVEESFIARLNPGDCFMFGGRMLELVRVRDMTAFVRTTNRNKPAVPRWQGGRMPLSSELADAVLTLLEEVRADRFDEPEIALLRPLFALQSKWSALPARDLLLVETTQSREGHHAFFFPFAGRQVHSGLAALIGWRIAQHKPTTFSMSFNDYGFELLSAEPIDWQAAVDRGLFSAQNLREHIAASLNAGELARRKFREIARVAGLIFQGYPGQSKHARQLQASSGLLFDVFERYDPDNKLLHQAYDESLNQELELSRLEKSLASMQQRRLALHNTPNPTPLAFPLMVERFRERLSNEKLSDRVAKMVAALEKAADVDLGEKLKRTKRATTSAA